MNYPDTQFIRAVGMILIINSHLTSYYPVSHFATGGAIGNSIFFCFSAFGLYLSHQKKNLPFGDWMKERISRIYPSVWIVLICLYFPIMLLSGTFRVEQITTYMGHFFYPPYWFIQALLVYYVLSFFFLKDTRRTKGFLLFGTLGILHFLIYFTWLDISVWSVETLPFKLIHYFMIFLFGIYLASMHRHIRYTGIHNVFLFLTAIAVLYGHKLMMFKGLYPEMQFIQQIVMYPLIYYLLKVSRSPFLLSLLGRSKPLSSTVQFISNRTLEFYVLQQTIAGPVLKLNLPFPLNVAVFVGLIFILSALVKGMADSVIKKNDQQTGS